MDIFFESSPDICNAGIYWTATSMNSLLFAFTALATGILWLVFMIVWIRSAFNAKRTVKRDYS